MDEVKAEIVILDDALDVGESLAFEITIRNESDHTVTLAPPLDGSFEGMRDPVWSIELFEGGAVVPAPFGHHELGRCGMTNPLTGDDLRKLPPGAALTLRGDDLAWLPSQTVLASSRPGQYRLRVRYEAGPGSALTPLSFTSAAADLSLRGGDERLWRCRTEQLAHQGDPHTNGGIYQLLSRGDGYLAVVGSHTEGYNAGTEISRGTLSVVALDRSLRPVTDPSLLWSGDRPGFVDVIDVPGGLLLAHTPEVNAARDGHRQVEIVAWNAQRGVTSRTKLGSPEHGYLVALARSGDRVGVAYTLEKSGSYELLFSALDLQGRPLGSPQRVGDDGYAGFPTLIATPEGFLVLWEAGAEQGRAQRLDRDGRPLGELTRFTFDGQTIASARALPDGPEIVYADGGYRGDDPKDGMGLYRVALPGGAPVALSPVDRQTARFGEGAWTADGRFLWAYLEGDTVRAGSSTTSMRTLSKRGGEPKVEALGDTFGVWWSDASGDGSVACRSLDACVYEGFAAVLGADGSLIAGPTRVTSLSAPKPLLPREGWERFCP